MMMGRYTLPREMVVAALLLLAGPAMAAPEAAANAIAKDASAKDAPTKDAATKDNAAKDAPAKDVAVKEPSTKEPTVKDATTKDVRSYCANIAAAASDARMAWQTERLGELELKIKGRIAELEAKTAELRAWIDKREEAERKAGEKLVDIYEKMKPETAAVQIAALDDSMAAAILGRLKPRQASLIFNELVPDRAAKLAGMIAGTVPTDEKKL